MAYRKHPQNSRKYKKSESQNDHKSHSYQSSNIEEPALPSVESAQSVSFNESVSSKEKKSPQAFSFLTSLFGSREKTERSDDPLISILGHDIYLDDLLLLGLILLLMTDKNEDEILIIILAYLLIDIF